MQPSNDLIEQLAKQTPLQYNECQTTATRKLELERFTEMIIRECALVIFHKIGPKSALDVLEHFGLREDE